MMPKDMGYGKPRSTGKEGKKSTFFKDLTRPKNSIEGLKTHMPISRKNQPS